MIIKKVMTGMFKNIATRRSIVHTVISNSKSTTAGIIVIGDEILHGEVIDSNSGYMTSRLYKMGITVKKISVIGDIIEEISDEVQIFSKKYNYVITTGGIGPTHDDLSFEAVAKAFNEPLILHPDLVRLVKRYYKTNDEKTPGMKLARVPKSTILTFPEKDDKLGKYNYPIVSVYNVYMFPGIPQLCERLFDLVSHLVFESLEKFYTRYVYFKVPEVQLIPSLEQVVKEFPNVTFGSYPSLYNSVYKVKITIQSNAEAETIAAYRRLLAITPKNAVVYNVK